MFKTKELIGREVIHKASGEKCARVRDVIFDRDVRRVLALVVSDGGLFREARVIPWPVIASIGDVLIVEGPEPVIRADSNAEIAEQMSGDGRVTGTQVMSTSGEKLGTIGDLLIDQRGHVIGFDIKQGWLSSHKFLAADTVQSFGKDALIAEASDLPSLKAARRELAAGDQADPPRPAPDAAPVERVEPAADGDQPPTSPHA